MKRIYHCYDLWEDYHAGLYDLVKEYKEQETERMAKQVKELLTDSNKFYEIGSKVTKEWTHAADVNLSNPSRNRQAWIGQASCCYVYGIPERITKLGWRLLSPGEQDHANMIADHVIRDWEERDKNAQKILK